MRKMKKMIFKDEYGEEKEIPVGDEPVIEEIKWYVKPDAGGSLQMRNTKQGAWLYFLSYQESRCSFVVKIDRNKSVLEIIRPPYIL